MSTDDKDIVTDGLYVHFPVATGVVRAVDDINVRFPAGNIIGIVGESGCGKSVLGHAILGMLPVYAQEQGRIYYQGIDVLSEREKVDNFYGLEFGIIPQHPAESFNPLRTINKQLSDVLSVGGKQLADGDKQLALLKLFGLQDAERVLAAYPHELSGGMQQRVLCAMGIGCKPTWILADEPTKGLDEKNCAVVYNNLQQIKQLRDYSMLIITHDISLARELCDLVAVMYAGQIVEIGAEVFIRPQHPYTKAFVAALPENGFQVLPGIAPTPSDNYQGCSFAPRCPQSMPICTQQKPPEYSVNNVKVRCFLYA